MNARAEQCLTRAKRFVVKGEEYYLKAREEILAAKSADPTLTNGQIGEFFGRGEQWVRDLVAWDTTSCGARTPFSGKQSIRDAQATRKTLKETPAVVKTLDPETQEAVARELTGPVLRAATGFRALGIVGHIKEATEELGENIDSLTPELLDSIETAAQGLMQEIDVAKSVLSLEREAV